MNAALAFLTVLGRGGPPPTRRARPWFGVVGAMVGGVVGTVAAGAAELWPPLVAGAAAVAADAALTGLLHYDGLADTADGLLPPLPRERRLAVMAAPDVGGFGVATVALVVALRVAGVAALVTVVSGWHLSLMVAGWWAASRTFMAAALATQPPARLGGLAAALGGGSALAAAAPGAALALALAIGAGGWGGLAGIAAVTIGAAAVIALARSRVGGVTGDVLGAAGLVGETFALLAGSARW